jgi:hypothetical protein
MVKLVLTIVMFSWGIGAGLGVVIYVVAKGTGFI